MGSRKSFYAVSRGRKPGIYTNWEECFAQVNGYENNLYKGFQTEAEAKRWLKQNRPVTQQAVKENGGRSAAARTGRYSVEKLNDEQRAAYDRMVSGCNIFLTGKAGTGKSFLLNCFIAMASGNKNVIVCAPTGIAALQIGGTTIHRAFGLKTGPLPPNQKIGKIKDVMMQADIIIIDEISMCRFDLFDYVCRYILAAEEKSKRKKQMIVVGDFCQLSPVVSQDDKAFLAEAWSDFISDLQCGYAFLSPMWEQMHFEKIVLKEVLRQKGDADFIEYLNRIRIGDPDGIEWFNQHTAPEEQKGIYMYGTDSNVRKKNAEEIWKLNQPMREYRGKINNFDLSLPTDESLMLCRNARVMSLVNDIKGRYQNGSMGIITKLKKKSVIVQFDNGTQAEMGPYKWEAFDYDLEVDPETGKYRLLAKVIGTFSQLPLKIAFAVTIHKSQGQTFEYVNLNPKCFAPGQLYVALSRATSAENLHLMEKIDRTDLKVSPEVRAFEGC